MARPIPHEAKIIEEILIPARNFMPARILKKGDFMRIIDVEGQQVADVILCDADNPKNVLSCSYTTLLNRTWKITTNHTLYSKFVTPMALITDDTVGVNCFTGGFCSSELNRFRYNTSESANCADNLASSLSRFGITRADLELDSCWCPFMNLSYDPDGGFMIREAPSKPGDYIEFRAYIDLIVAISNCPQDKNPCNAGRPSPLKVITYSMENE